MKIVRGKYIEGYHQHL